MLIKWIDRPNIINEIDHLFNSIKYDYANPIRSCQWAPNFEVLNTDESYIVRADLPGLTKKDVNIELSDGIVKISGERKNEYSNDDSQYRYSELSYGSFSKKFTLPEDAIEDKINAKMRDGVMTIEVPRMEPIKPKTKTISIK